jgi:hypothetical protein
LRELFENLIVYLAVPGESVTDSILFRSDSTYASLGLSLIGDIHFIFWEEGNGYRWTKRVGDPDLYKDGDWPYWHDTFPQWLKLYDYFVSAVRDVETDPSAVAANVDVKVGTKIYKGYCLNQNDCRRGYVLNDVDTFIRFLTWNPPQAICFNQLDDYEYQSDNYYPYEVAPMDLDFIARQNRTNEHQLLSLDEECGGNNSLEPCKWYIQPRSPVCENATPLDPHDPDIYGGYEHHVFEKVRDNYEIFFPPPQQVEWYSLDVAARTNSVIYDSILPGNTDFGPYPGIELDNHMGAVNYLAQVWDHFESENQTTIPISHLKGLWAEFWALGGSGLGGDYGGPGYPDDGEWPDHDEDTKKSAWDYGFYKGNSGMLYTNSMGLNMYELPPDTGATSVKKAYYNVAEMMSKLKGTQLNVTYENLTWPLFDRRDFIRGVITKDELTGDHAVLFWYYLNPDDFIPATPGNGYAYYDDILERVESMGLAKTIGIELNGLPSFQGYKLTRYVVNETLSNGWSYRTDIFDIYQAAENEHDKIAAIANINDCTLNGDCDIDGYDLSVALEKVDDGILISADSEGKLEIEYPNISPWTAMLLVLEKEMFQ